MLCVANTWQLQHKSSNPHWSPNIKIFCQHTFNNFLCMRCHDFNKPRRTCAQKAHLHINKKLMKGSSCLRYSLMSISDIAKRNCGYKDGCYFRERRLATPKQARDLTTPKATDTCGWMWMDANECG